MCQLACPSCSTTNGIVKARLGSGFLRFENFRRVVDHNPWISEIELSNWGEIFLNPEIEEIIAYAYRRNVALSAWNGANLNHVKESVLEALVRYRFRAITCSIDGATGETYEVYRRKGNLARVLANIGTINEHKARYRSRHPHLSWQMVAFGHNAGEIGAARALASELGMSFALKGNWDPGYSPLERTDPAPSTRDEAELVPVGEDQALVDEFCHQLWREPQVNFDGTLLGCCVNTWGSFGANVFSVELSTALEGEELTYAKAMLTGRARPRDDIPCSTCPHYTSRARANQWLPAPATRGLMATLRRHGMGRAVVWLDNRFGTYLLPIVRTLRIS